MSELKTIKADYWRNRDGSIIHTNDCIYSGSKGANPWIFAQSMPQSLVRDLVASKSWLRLCARCWKGDDDA